MGARVTPTSSSQGRTRASTPRTEMRGLLMLTRLIDELLPGIQVPPAEIRLMGDSQCTIACVEADNRVLKSAIFDSPGQWYRGWTLMLFLFQDSILSCTSATLLENQTLSTLLSASTQAIVHWESPINLI